MSSENVTPILRSMALSSRWNQGRLAQDRLMPSPWRRLQRLYQQVWREEVASNTLNFGSKNFSYLLPESLQVLSSMFLRVNLADLGSSTYKQNPGLYVIKSMRVLSGGNTAYEIQNYGVVLRDYLESLSTEEYFSFCEAYLGHTANLSPEGRTVHCPILLPNSHFLIRSSKGKGGQGILPCGSFGDTRLEIQLTLCEANEITSDISVNAPNINNSACVFAMREVKMNDNTMSQYKSHAGNYSVMSRRFTPILSNFQVAEADTAVTQSFQKVQGSVTELQIIAYPWAQDQTRQEFEQTVVPTKIKLVVDSITVRNFNSASKVKLHNYKNGFTSNRNTKDIGRICFAISAAESGIYTGAFNMRTSSNIRLELEFAEKVHYNVYAVQLMSNEIQASGVLKSFLE